MYVGPVEAGVELLTTRTVRDMDVEYRAPQDVLERVLVVNNSTPAPLLQNEETRWEKVKVRTAREVSGLQFCTKELKFQGSSNRA